jgi:PAS domain S-box-containing protein
MLFCGAGRCWLDRRRAALLCMRLPFGGGAMSALARRALALALLVLAQTCVALNLTPAERAWLAAHRPLRVGVVLQAPFAQLDSRSHKLYGANIELMDWLAGQLQAQLVWQPYPTATALEQAVRAQQVDLAPGLTQTPVGLRTWLFSDPYLRIPHKVVGRRESATSVDLEQLPIIDRIAVKSPSAVDRFLASNYPVLVRVPVASERIGLQQLQAGEVDYAVADEAQLNMLLREPEFTRLFVVGDTGYTQLLRVATRKELPELARLIDRGLQAMPESKRSQLYERWVLPNYPHITDSLGFWHRLSALLTLLAAGMAVGWWWNTRQRHFVEQRLATARHDLELRAATEEALRLTQFSVDLSTVGILWVNWDSRVRYANQAAQQMLGYPADHLVGQQLRVFEPKLDMDRWLALWKQVRGEGSANFESNCLRADGSWLPVDVTLSFLRFRDAEYLVAFVTDVTEKRQARAALEASEAMLRDLSAHLETVREEEKARIAREVHDELGQVLTVLKLETSMCELGFSELSPALTERLQSMKKLIDQTFSIVRDVATALRPPILDAGIGSAVEWQARRFEARTQIPCLTVVPEAPVKLSDAKAVGLFRILQEALTNVLRHAEAHTVELHLQLKEGELELIIADDGKGFDVERDRRDSSFGLIGIRERVLMLGGRLNIQSEPGEGTTLTVTVPLEQDEGVTA